MHNRHVYQCCRGPECIKQTNICFLRTKGFCWCVHIMSRCSQTNKRPDDHLFSQRAVKWRVEQRQLPIQYKKKNISINNSGCALPPYCTAAIYMPQQFSLWQTVSAHQIHTNGWLSDCLCSLCKDWFSSGGNSMNRNEVGLLLMWPALNHSASTFLA